MAIVKIKSFRYVLDWYEEKDVEINTDDFYCFRLELRGSSHGDWYLKHYQLLDGKIVEAYNFDFNLSSAADAVNILGDKIKGFQSLHSKSIVKMTRELLDRASAVKQH